MTSQTTSNLEKKKYFILKNKNFFLDIVSFRYGFTHDQLRKYKTILKWDNIVCNDIIKWSIYITEEFKDLIFQEEHIFELSCSESLPWSIEFIERYQDLWSWEVLAQNTCVMGNPILRKHFHKQLSPYYDEYLERCSRDFNSRDPDNLKFSDELEREAELFSKHRELQFLYPEEIIQAQDIDWRWLSFNTLLPWSSDLIEKYVELWDWEALGKNKSVPWDLEMLKKFEHKIDWTVDVPDEEGIKKITACSISYNSSIEWDAAILSQFLNKLDSFPISLFGNGEWNIELLIQFNDFWDMNELYLNKAVWEKTFLEFHTQEHLIPLLDSLQLES